MKRYFSKISEAEVLNLGVLVDAVLGALSADARFLHAAERGLRATLIERQRKFIMFFVKHFCLNQQVLELLIMSMPCIPLKPANRLSCLTFPMTWCSR